MATEFKLPELSENAKEGTVTSILVKVGDTIAVDQNLLEIEAGKATVEIPSPYAGTVTAIQVKEGDTAAVGQVVMTIDEAGGSAAAPASKAKAAKEETKASAPKQEAVASAPAPEPAAPAPAPAKKSAPAPAPKAASKSAITGISSAGVPASPSTRQFAREIGIDINEVPGEAPGARITMEDVKRYSRDTRAHGGGGGGPISAPLPDFTRWGDVEAEPLSNVRAATAQHMAISWSNIPHVTINESVDITNIEKLRKSQKSKAEAAGAKLTLTPFLIKILASALKVFPRFNASLDLEHNQLIYKKYVGIGVAIDTDRGLLVPVIRNADQLSVIEIARELGNIADRAKARKIPPDEMVGGSMTLTNIGGIGGSFFTPIVNFPEVAILGVGRGSVQPVLVDGFFQPRQMLPLSLSFDHRVIDGADGARFLRWISDALQQPELLILEG
ncbi:MAG: 2-oxo acid dehydrogenase subunit E2 [Kiritimatiellia bacterium]|jgi:pyruvate dehydrogenase E2 component (dihydrolipoamide acetyltransferase)